MLETFLLVLAAIFPVVNPPGAALVFLSMTQHASIDTRRSLARGRWRTRPAAVSRARGFFCPWSARRRFLGRQYCEKSLILLARPKRFELLAPKFVVR